MPTREEEELARHARALMHHGRAGEAERVWRQLLAKHHVIDIEYDDWLRGAADCYRALRRHREVGLIYLFLHYFEQARADAAARAMWERVEADPRLAGPSYERALVETNLGLCAGRLGDGQAS